MTAAFRDRLLGLGQALRAVAMRQAAPRRHAFAKPLNESLHNLSVNCPQLALDHSDSAVRRLNGASIKTSRRGGLRSLATLDLEHGNCGIINSKVQVSERSKLCLNSKLLILIERPEERCASGRRERYGLLSTGSERAERR
jgi:hypothetical protein